MTAKAGYALALASIVTALGCKAEPEQQTKALVAASPAALAVPTAAAPAATPPPAADTTATGIAGVVADGTKVKVIGEGFKGTEGPITLPDGSLIFTETNANRITRIAANDEKSTFLENTNGSNGLGFDAEGRLISVQTTRGQTRVGVIYPPGREQTFTDHFEGKPYGRPNDLVVGKSGAVYFTEPGPNAPTDGSTPAPPPLSPAVYHVTSAGKVQRVAEGIERPNGIILSRDEKTLYVNNTQGEFLLAFDVQPDGTLQNRRNFAAYQGVTRSAEGKVASGADGLAIDAEGRLYVASTIGVQVIDAGGRHLGTIPVSRSPQNIAFAGADRRTLYIVGRGAAYKVALLTPGFGGRAK